MAQTYKLEPYIEDKEKYYVDFSVFSTVAKRHKFRELQETAFSKGVGWRSTGFEIEPFNMSSGDYGGHHIMICLKANSSWKGKYIAYGKEGTKIEYRALIKKLREL